MIARVVPGKLASIPADAMEATCRFPVDRAYSESVLGSALFLGGGPTVPTNLLRFGGFELDPANFQLRRSGRPVRLERIPLEVLLLLVERRGQLVRRQDIADSVWGRDIVLDVDNALNTAIRKVRRALGDNPDHPRYVETVAAKGYRFIGAVTSVLRTDTEKIPWIDRERASSPPAPSPFDTSEPSIGNVVASKGHADGELRQVTALVAHLKGSMDWLVDRDTEKQREFIDPVLHRLIEAVHRYEGTVNQVTEDGILAVFGAPFAHEDHAIRACYAALCMQESLMKDVTDVSGPEVGAIQVGIGLNTGEMVIRAASPGQPLDLLAVSHTTHLAAGLAQLAPSGAVLATADILRLIDGFVRVTSLGPTTVKGLSRAVDVYQLTERGTVRSQLQAAAARGFSKFVGRDIEMMQLQRALEQTQDGRGQAVAIVGDPGVGKSRLVFELTHSHDLRSWLVLEARSVSYGKGTAFLPVIDLLKSYFGIGDRDTPHDIQKRVTEKTLALSRALEPMLPALLALLDVPIDDRQWQELDAPERRQRTMDAVKRLLLREAQVQPVLVVFEDLHWIDSETETVLDGLIDSLPATRLLLLVNYRPEYRHGWGNKMYYTQLRLDTLLPESTGELLDDLLGPRETLQPLKSLLAARAGGNPFFIEEGVRTLVETKALLGERGAYDLDQPVEMIQVPATVQAVLAARIDRLPPGEKRLLEIAAVIGKNFPLALLQEVADETEETLRRSLAQLTTAEFLYEQNLSPDSEYTFKHSLTHEVAYRSLLRARRRDLHARIAEAMERLYADRLAEQVERLAQHALRGELQEKAVRHLRQAGNKAAARLALPDARAWFEQALGVLDTLPQDQSTLAQAVDIRVDMRLPLSEVGEICRALERLREAEELAERSNDEPRRGRVCAMLTNMHAQLGELDEALAAGTRAVKIARDLGDSRLRILATSYLEQAHYFRGEYERAVELGLDNLAALPVDWVHEHLGLGAAAGVYVRAWLVMSLAELGRFTEGAEYEADALQLAGPTHRAYTIGYAYRAASMLHLLKGDWTEVRSLTEQWVAAFQPGSINLLSQAVAVSAWVSALFGNVAKSLDRLHEAKGLLHRLALVGTRDTHSWTSYALGRACLLLGRLDEARQYGDGTVESSPRPGVVAYALYLLGDIATHSDSFDAARGEAHYRKALALAEPRGMRPLVAHCHLGLGKLYRRTGRQQEAQEHLTTATRMYREMGMTYWMEQAEAERET